MLNKVMLIGRVGKDPEMKTFDNGTLNAKFSLATSERYKNKEGEKVENVEWHNIVVFGNLAGVIEKYVKKGSLLHLEGKIKNRSWDAQDGTKKYMTEIHVNNMVMLGGNDANNGGSNESYTPKEAVTQPPKKEKLPF